MAQTPSLSNGQTAPEKILLVDDNPTNLQVLLQTLDGEGYDLLVAKSGEAALQIAAKSRPAVILLDIMMPGIDGWETLSRLKSTPETEAIPVIIFTAREHSRGKQLAREMGAADYFPKPFEPDELINIVEEYAAPTAA